MSKINDIRELFSKGFKVADRWTDWYFNDVYDDADALISYSNSRAASCLMLNRYTMKLGSQLIDTGYISCATTAPQLRGQGHMRRLITDSLMDAASRGYSLVSLIPASSRLYFYYDHFGFSTVFYADIQRYTSLHRFPFSDAFIETAPSFESFNDLEMRRYATILHSRRDFNNIIADNEIDNGIIISLAEKSSGKPAAMLFATLGETAATVHDLLSTSDEASDTALEILRRRIGEMMIIVDSVPTDGSPAFLKSRGMTRIVNANSLLSAIAAQFPETEQVIRLRDNIIPDNNAIFIIHAGHVEKTNSTMRRITIDISAEILAKIIFNSGRIGHIFSIPTFRPVMSLMLE